MRRLQILLVHKSIPLMVVFFFSGLAILTVQGPGWVWGFAALGIPLQMLNEYSLHRYVFHLPAPRQQWKFDLLYQAHYGHHDFPTNFALFFVPGWVSLPILVLNFAVTWTISGWIFSAHAFSVACAIVLVGGVGTFLSYEWFHMTAHLPVNKTWLERRVALLHGQHHFRNFSRWFHVSPGGEFIDRIMGTAIDPEELKCMQRAEFMTTLGLAPDDPRLVASRQKFAEKYGLTSNEIEAAAGD